MARELIRYYDRPTDGKEHKTSDDRYHYIAFKSDGVPFRYSVKDPVSRRRVERLFTAEPETLFWFASLPEDDVLFDVGSNVGMYSIYATLMSRVRTFAFEPESQSFARLQENIKLNDLFDRCTGFCVGIGENPVQLTRLYLCDFHTGWSKHQLGEDPRKEEMGQGCVEFSLDHLVFEMKLPAPNHVKIDVDGHEPSIVRGAKRLLQDQRLRSLMVECNSGLETYGMIQTIIDAGFDICPDQLRIRSQEFAVAGGSLGLGKTEDVMRAFNERRLWGNILFTRDKEYSEAASRVVARYLDSIDHTAR